MRRARLVLVACALALVPYFAWWAWQSWRVGVVLTPSIPFRRFERPYGMAPIAFRAFLQACNAAKVSPNRIAQTLGNNPRSKGYHLQDGVLNGESYCAAVDLGVSDLSPAKRGAFLEAMACVGFIAWYRSGPKWVGDEHVHAVYAGLPMKPQLRAQVRLWSRERARSGRKPLRWQKKWRKFWA